MVYILAFVASLQVQIHSGVRYGALMNLDCWRAECNCQASVVLFVLFLWQCSTCRALLSLTPKRCGVSFQFTPSCVITLWIRQVKNNADAERRMVMLWVWRCASGPWFFLVQVLLRSQSKIPKRSFLLPFYQLENHGSFECMTVWQWGLSSTLHACDLLSCSPKVNDAKYNGPFCHFFGGNW